MAPVTAYNRKMKNESFAAPSKISATAVGRVQNTDRAVGIDIRPATVADVPQILAFIRELAAYERQPDAVEATEEQLRADGFGPEPFYHCLLAEQGEEAVGFAFYFFNYSTWLGKPGIYLEDIYVRPTHRGLGIGKALLKCVAATAVTKGYERMQWAVLDWNTPAIDFYRAVGADFLDEWRNVRISGDALLKLAGSDPVQSAQPVSSQQPCAQPRSSQLSCDPPHYATPQSAQETPCCKETPNPEGAQ